MRAERQMPSNPPSGWLIARNASRNNRPCYAWNRHLDDFGSGLRSHSAPFDARFFQGKRSATLEFCVQSWALFAPKSFWYQFSLSHPSLLGIELWETKIIKSHMPCIIFNDLLITFSYFSIWNVVSFVGKYVILPSQRRHVCAYQSSTPPHFNG